MNTGLSTSKCTKRNFSDHRYFFVLQFGLKKELSEEK